MLTGMRTTALLTACVILLGCKGRQPNYVRKDLPVAGDPYGPEDEPTDSGFSHAFAETYVHVVTARGMSIRVDTWREDGVHQGQTPILDVPDELLDASSERLAQDIGQWVLEWEEQEAIDECLAQGPKKRSTSLRLHPDNLLALPEGGWALAFTARLVLQCQTPSKVKKRRAYFHYILSLDDQFSPTTSPELVRYGPPSTTEALVLLGGVPTLAWVSDGQAGFVAALRRCPLPTKDGELDYAPIFVPTDTGVAVVTRVGNSIRVRLIGVGAQTTKPLVDLSIDPGLAPLSHTAAWTGDRLGIFMAVDKTEGTGTILSHILVEVFPDGTTSPARKVYTQYSFAEDAQFTRQLEAIAVDDGYALAWLADDGYNQDVHLQEVPLGGQVDPADKLTWHLDLGDGFRALKELTLYATPPQYVLELITAIAHEIRLTALPTDR